ncbi:MAG: HD-GYP domain-containing protein [Defluviitaleaceae bacterium]|nr:HD-GYP domain-containing protein [Defluviitaleaceae bacterium]
MKEVDLIPIPIDTLHIGTFVQDNIYAHDSSQLLIKAGTFIDDRILERVKHLNGGKPTVFLAGLPLKSLAMPQDEMEKRRKALEKATGYDKIADEAVDYLSETAKNKSVDPVKLKVISHMLSNWMGTASSAIVLTLVNALAPVDEYLQRHCVNTAFLNGLMGKWMGLPLEAVSRLALIGLLHDCGKALMPHSILNEHRRLTVVEYEVIKTHPLHSYELLSDFPEDVRFAARGHHEKMNGTGYPDGLANDAIPIESRITAISDIYDALVAQRAYKEPRSPFNVLALLKRIAGRELDERLVNLFLTNIPKELIGKQVVLSNGTVAYVREIDYDDIEYPIVNQFGERLKTNETLYCTSMY